MNDSVSNDGGAKVTFMNESDDRNTWTDTAKIGLILGFGSFGLGIMGVVAMIAMDMRKRMQMYEDKISEDMTQMTNLGLQNKFKEMEVELAARLAGGKDETGVDDQLVTQALELRHEEFAAHM